MSEGAAGRARPDNSTEETDMTIMDAERATIPFPRVVHVPDAAPAAPPPTVSVVIPTLNEADNLRHVMPLLPAWVDEVIVVDGGSTDGTVDVARSLWPDVVVVEQGPRRGKGIALARGFASATGDIIVMLDADGSTSPTEIPRYVAALRTGADFAKGTRFMTGGGSSDITRLRRLGNKVLSGTVNMLWGTKFSDLCYGYNAFWREHLPALSADCPGFEIETLLNIRAARTHLKIVEVPSFESPRLHGESNLKVGRDGLRVLRMILSERIRPS
jgi:glycosyltransferase involved in cell wall biosynthesis